MNAGDHIGDWIVEGPLGEGGMGAVWRVHNSLSNSLKAAVKTLKPHDLGSGRERFAQELQALATLVHPGIVRVLGGGEDRERAVLYLVMELLSGQTLEARTAQGPLAPAEAIPLFRSVAESLAFAHSHGIFHRDVKPSNIMLVAGSGPKLIDFGVAKQQIGGANLTVAGTVTGTMAYLAPEVFRDDQPDPARCDIYALGQTLYEALTGQLAFGDGMTTGGTQMGRLVAKKLDAKPLDPGTGFTAELREVVKRASHPDPAQRYPGMAELADALGQLAVDPLSQPWGAAATRSALGPTNRPPSTVAAKRSELVAEPAGAAVSGPVSSGKTPVVPVSTANKTPATGTPNKTPASGPPNPGATSTREAKPSPPAEPPPPPPTADTPPPPPKKSNTGLFIGVGVLLLLGLGAVGVAVVGGGAALVATSTPEGGRVVFQVSGGEVGGMKVGGLDAKAESGGWVVEGLPAGDVAVQVWSAGTQGWTDGACPPCGACLETTIEAAKLTSGAPISLTLPAASPGTRDLSVRAPNLAEPHSASFRLDGVAPAQNDRATASWTGLATGDHTLIVQVGSCEGAAPDCGTTNTCPSGCNSLSSTVSLTCGEGAQTVELPVVAPGAAAVVVPASPAPATPSPTKTPSKTPTTPSTPTTPVTPSVPTPAPEPEVKTPAPVAAVETRKLRIIAPNASTGVFVKDSSGAVQTVQTNQYVEVQVGPVLVQQGHAAPVVGVNVSSSSRTISCAAIDSCVVK